MTAPKTTATHVRAGQASKRAAARKSQHGSAAQAARQSAATKRAGSLRGKGVKKAAPAKRAPAKKTTAAPDRSKEKVTPRFKGTPAKNAAAELSPPAADASQLVGVLQSEHALRVAAASKESKLLREWTRGGEKGERPATPNLDAINNGEKGATARRASGATAKASTPRAAKPPKGDKLFTIEGAKGPKRNLSDLAYDATKGLGPKGTRLSIADFRKLLVRLGCDPDGEFDVTLDNGKHVIVKKLNPNVVVNAPEAAKHAAKVAKAAATVAAKSTSSKRVTRKAS